MPRMVIELGRGVKVKLRRERRETRDKGLAMRCQIVLLAAKRRGPAAIADGVGCSRSWVYEVLRRFQEFGVAGLYDRREDNGCLKLDERFLSVLYDLVDGTPQQHGYLRPTWTRELLVEVMATKTDVRVHPATMSRALAQIGARRGRPRPTVSCPWKKAAKQRRLRQLTDLLTRLPKGEPDFVRLDQLPSLRPSVPPQALAGQAAAPGQARGRGGYLLIGARAVFLIEVGIVRPLIPGPLILIPIGGVAVRRKLLPALRLSGLICALLLFPGTVAKYMVRTRKPLSQTWRMFLANHISDIAACDFFTVPTVTFRVLYVFIVLRHDRREIVHFNVTTNPYAEWSAQQIINAFPYEEAPRFLLRDRDGIYGDHFQKRLKNMGIEEVLIAPRSPWQNPYCERVIGTIRRECLDHMIVLGEAHLKRVLTAYFQYYHEARCHLALDRNAPRPRQVEAPDRGAVISIPQVGGLHHRYTRCAA